MKRLFKIKRNESPKPPQKPIRLDKPADIAAGPPDNQAEADAGPDGGQNLSYESPGADRTDLTVPPDERGKVGPRMVFQDGMVGNQELPASGASTSGASAPGVMIGDADNRNQLASKFS